MDNTELANAQRERAFKAQGNSRLPLVGVAAVVGLVMTVAAASFTSNLPDSPAAPDNSVSRYACEQAVKSLLRDPDSFQQIQYAGDESQDGWGLMHFRARNGFGGYNDSYAKCTLADGYVTAALITN
jgi:hypothetical protein